MKKEPETINAFLQKKYLRTTWTENLTNEDVLWKIGTTTKLISGKKNGISGAHYEERALRDSNSHKT